MCFSSNSFFWQILQLSADHVTICNRGRALTSCQKPPRYCCHLTRNFSILSSRLKLFCRAWPHFQAQGTALRRAWWGATRRKFLPGLALISPLRNPSLAGVIGRHSSNDLKERLFILRHKLIFRNTAEYKLKTGKKKLKVLKKKKFFI